MVSVSVDENIFLFWDKLNMKEFCCERLQQ